MPAAPSGTTAPGDDARPPANAEAYLGAVEAGADVWLRRDAGDSPVVCVRTRTAECGQRGGVGALIVLPGGTVAGVVDDSRATTVLLSVDGGPARAARAAASARGPLLFAVPGAVRGGRPGPLLSEHDAVVTVLDSRGEQIGRDELLSAATKAARTPPSTAGDEVAVGDAVATRVWAAEGAEMCVGTRTAGVLQARRCSTAAPDDLTWVDPQAAPGGLLLMRLPTGSTAATLDGRALTVHQAPNAVWGWLVGGVPADATRTHVEVSANGQVTHRALLAKLAVQASWELPRS